MTMRSHIAATCKSCFYHLRNIRSIRPCLTVKAAEALVHACITSRLDYCNSLLHGTPKYAIAQLQHVQNCAARLIAGVHKFDHITPVLQRLHWLPVQLRVEFKVLLLVFKALHGMAPKYVCDLLQEAQPSRCLRSSSQGFLYIPRTNLVSAGDRAFSVTGPKLWNRLPEAIRKSSSITVFKQNLKTHLFKQYYQ